MGGLGSTHLDQLVLQRAYAQLGGMLHAGTPDVYKRQVLMDSLPETLEKLKDRSAGRAAGRALAAASWAMLACLVVCVYSWSMDANVKFHKAKLDYENMYAQCATFLALAEANEEYVQGLSLIHI